MMSRLVGVLVTMVVVATTALAQTPNPETIALPLQANESGPIIAPAIETSAPAIGRGIPFWVNNDYLFAFVRGSAVPPLLTTSPSGAARIDAGVLGTAGTETLFGNTHVDGGIRAGFRVAGGCWLSAERTLGVEAGFAILESQVATFSTTSDTFPILARPFRSAIDSTQQSALIAFPGSSNGTVDIRAVSTNFYGAHIDLAEMALNREGFQLISLLGYRFYRYDEGIVVRQNVAAAGGNFVPGTQIDSIDDFSTRNEFHGVDLGFRAQFQWERNGQRFGLDLLGKVAVGAMAQRANVSGIQTTTVPGTTPVINSGGVLALDSNIGAYSSTNVKILPEAGATLYWQVRPNVNLRLGYTFLLMQGIARASDQIDLTVNPNLFPPPNPAAGGAARPAFSLNRTDVWIQSINLGLEFVY